MASKMELDALPALLSQKEVHGVFGLTRQELRKLERAESIHRFKVNGSRKGKYFKRELMALCRMEERTK